MINLPLEDNYLIATHDDTIVSIIPAPNDLRIFRQRRSGQTWMDRPLCLGLVRRRWTMANGEVRTDPGIVVPILTYGEVADFADDVTGWGFAPVDTLAAV